MLKENRTFQKEESKSFPLLKNDVYQCQLVDVSMSVNNKYQSDEKEEVLSFEFAVLGVKDAEGTEARTRLLAKNFVPTYLYISRKTGKNWLYKITEALLGRDLSQEEEANGITSQMINSLAGKQCRLLLEKVQSKKDSTKFYSNIANILPADSEITPLTSEEMAQINDKKAKMADKSTNGQTNQQSAPVAPNYDEIPDSAREEIRIEDIPS